MQQAGQWSVTVLTPNPWMYTRSPQWNIPRSSGSASGRQPATVELLSGLLAHAPSMKGTSTKLLLAVTSGGRFWVTFLHRVAANVLISSNLIERPEPLMLTWEAKSDF